MPACPQCQSTVSDDARFCHNCGSPILSRMARRQNKINTSLYGIGGWLILVTIGLISSIIVIFTACLDYYIEELYVQAVIHVILVIYGIICLLHLLRHSPAFPLLFTIYACAGTAAGLILQTRDFIASGQWLSLSLLLSSLPLTILWIFYMRRSMRVKNTFEKAAPSPGPTASIGEPSGLGGLMIFVDLGLFLGIFSALVDGIQYLMDGFLLTGLLMLGITGYGIVCMIFMFRYSRHFPKLFIGLLTLLFTINFVMLFIVYLATKNVSNILVLIPMAFWSMVWITYMLRSKRVKNTFVR